MQWANAKPHIDGHLTRKTSQKLVDDSVIASRFASNIASQQCKRSLANASIAKTRCMSLFVFLASPTISPSEYGEPIPPPRVERSSQKWNRSPLEREYLCFHFELLV